MPSSKELLNREQLSLALRAQGYTLAEEPLVDAPVPKATAEATAPPLELVKTVYRGGDSTYGDVLANAALVNSLDSTSIAESADDPVSMIVKVHKEDDTDTESPAREVVLTQSGKIVGFRG